MSFLLETLLFVFYTAIFIVIIKKWSFFYKHNIPKHITIGLFIAKILVGFIVYQIYTNVYTIRKDADVFKYFDDSLVIYKSLWDKPLDFINLMFSKTLDNEYFLENYYMKMDNWTTSYNSIFYGDSVLIIKINAILRIFSFGNFHIQALLFSFLGFIGLFAIYKSLQQILNIESKYYILSVFCLPSVFFWSSSIFKETLLLLFVGIIFLQLSKIYLNKKVYLKSLIIIIIFIYILMVLKFYVAFALIIPIISYLINIQYKPKKIIYTYIITTIIFAFIFFNTGLIDVMILKQQGFINLAESTKAGSYFNIQKLEPNFISIIKSIPEGFINSLLRPFPKEGMSIMNYPAVLENIIILIGLFMIIRIVRNKKYWENNKNNLFLIISFSIILFTVIGITTPIAGALVRYKVAALPFVSTFIFYFLEKNKTKKL